MIVYYDNQKLKELVFQHGPVQFGRLPTCDVRLDYPFISRNHFHLTEENGSLVIRDSGSRNGLIIDGQVRPFQVIEDKLDLKLDKLEVKISLDQPKSSEVGVVKTIQNAETVVQHEPIQPKLPGSLKPQGGLGGATENPNVRQQISDAQTVVDIPAARQKSGGNHSAVGNHLHGAPILGRSFEGELINIHPGLQAASQKRLEAVVYWQDQVFEVREFEPNERVTIGSSPFSTIRLPTIPKGWALAKVDFDKADCYVPKDKTVSLTKNGQTFTGQDLINNNYAKSKGSGISFKMSQYDIVNVDVGGGMKVFLRYIPATKPLTRKKLTEPDFAIKQAMLGSAILHGIFSLLLIIFAPTGKPAPKLKNVPERYARLLVEPPKPIIPVPEPPPPPPPPEPKKEVAKPEPKKPEPKKVVKVEKEKPKKMELPKKLEKQNKFPMIVKNPMPNQPVAKVNNPSPTPPPKEPPPVKVEALGALAALGPVSNDPSPAPAMNNIKIDKNAGGLASKTPNTQGLMGALPSPTGKLMAVGSGSVKTGGKGIGAGVAYGTQGLSGGAGTRAVGGGVVGQPKLATSSGKTEGLTRQQVMEVVQKHLAEVQACYEKSLLSTPSLAGRMEFEWDIEASGSVSAVRIKRSTVNNGDALGSCVKGVFSAMRFPAAKNGQSTTPNIGFPFGRL